MFLGIGGQAGAWRSGIGLSYLFFKSGLLQIYELFCGDGCAVPQLGRRALVGVGFLGVMRVCVFGDRAQTRAWSAL